MVIPEGYIGWVEYDHQACGSCSENHVNGGDCFDADRKKLKVTDDDEIVCEQFNEGDI